MSAAAGSAHEAVVMLLRELKMPAVARLAGELAQQAEREGWSFGQYLRRLMEAEVEERRQRPVERYQRASHLPVDKTLGTLDKKRLPAAVAKRLPTICEGGFLERGVNVLCFGLPGRGKTHVNPDDDPRKEDPELLIERGAGWGDAIVAVEGM